MVRKIQNVAHGRGAKRIDRLSVVADDGEAFAAWPQRQQHRSLEPVGILIFVDQQMIEPLRNLGGDRGLLHHVRPVEQQVVVIEQVLALFCFDILGEQRSQLVVPARAPRIVRAQDFFERRFAVHRTRIDRKTCAFGRKALLGSGKSKIVTDQIHQVRRILAIVDGEAGRKPDRFGVFAQQPRAYGVERPGPGEPLGNRAMRAAKLKQDQVYPADHFRSRPPGKRQKHHAPRIGALPDQPRHAMRQRRGLAGTSAGNDQQRARRRPMADRHARRHGVAAD